MAKKSAAKRIMYVNLSDDLQKRVNAHCEKICKETGVEVKSSAVIRSFVERGLQAVEKR
jgi:hypothetical protein